MMSYQAHASRVSNLKFQNFECKAPQESPASARILRTLIIDDNEFDRKRITRLCNETGLKFKFTSIAGTSELRAHLDHQKFDLILVDFRLHEEDGLAAVRRIRSHPAHLHCAILMLTGQMDIEVAVEAMKAGCSDYMDKSMLSPNALRRATMNAIEKTALNSDLMRARGINDKLSTLIRNFADDNAAEMKPIVLKMMRRARSKLAAPAVTKDEDAQEVDLACRKLWLLIEAMEENAHRVS